MRSIFTKFVGATNARGARIVAKVNDWKAGDPGKVSVPFDYASRNPHDVAVEALSRKLGWFDTTYVRAGGENGGYVYVPVIGDRVVIKGAE